MVFRKQSGGLYLCCCQTRTGSRHGDGQYVHRRSSSKHMPRKALTMPIDRCFDPQSPRCCSERGVQVPRSLPAAGARRQARAVQRRSRARCRSAAARSGAHGAAAARLMAWATLPPSARSGRRCRCPSAAPRPRLSGVPVPCRTLKEALLGPHTRCNHPAQCVLPPWLPPSSGRGKWLPSCAGDCSSREDTVMSSEHLASKNPKTSKPFHSQHPGRRLPPAPARLCRQPASPGNACWTAEAMLPAVPQAALQNRRG